MATPPEIEKALTVLSYAYPNFDLPKETVQIYIRLLADLDFELLKAATLQCATINKFFPTVAEIRAAATELQAMAEGVPSGIEAWGQVLRQMRDVGSYGRPSFSHPLIDSIVHQFGWKNLCLSENSVSDRARFLDAYAQALQSENIKHRMLTEVRDIVDRRALEIKRQLVLLTEGMETQ
jgi:hypothetical protein